MKIIAHRGASALAKENSIASFKKAIEIGADMVEFDVRRTKDDQLITFHDDDINGTPIAEMTYKEIRKVHPETPKLADVLKTTKKKMHLDVELKESGYEKHVLDMILTSFSPNEFVITTFLDDVIEVIKQSHPEIRVGLLLGKDKPKHIVRTRLSELFPIKRAKRCGADFVAPNYQLLILGFLRRAKRNKMGVFVWTVNESKLLDKWCNHPGIEAVITDMPHIALERIKK